MESYQVSQSPGRSHGLSFLVYTTWRWASLECSSCHWHKLVTLWIWKRVVNPSHNWLVVSITQTSMVTITLTSRCTSHGHQGVPHTDIKVFLTRTSIRDFIFWKLSRPEYTILIYFVIMQKVNARRLAYLVCWNLNWTDTLTSWHPP